MQSKCRAIHYGVFVCALYCREMTECSARHRELYHFKVSGSHSAAYELVSESPKYDIKRSHTHTHTRHSIRLDNVPHYIRTEIGEDCVWRTGVRTRMRMKNNDSNPMKVKRISMIKWKFAYRLSDVAIGLQRLDSAPSPIATNPVPLSHALLHGLTMADSRTTIIHTAVRFSRLQIEIALYIYSESSTESSGLINYTWSCDIHTRRRIPPHSTYTSSAQRLLAFWSSHSV